MPGANVAPIGGVTHAGGLTHWPRAVNQLAAAIIARAASGIDVIFISIFPSKPLVEPLGEDRG